MKVRIGPPVDDEADVRDRPDVWAGVVPLRVVADAPLACPTVPKEVHTPAHLHW